MDARSEAPDIVSIREIIVVQPWEFDKSKGEFNIEPDSGQPESIDSICKRMIEHICNMAEIAKHEHLQRNFDHPEKFDLLEKPDATTSKSCKLKVGCKNKITRLTFNEFHFYPYKESGPLTLEHFSRLIEEIEQIAKRNPENMHMILSSFPIVDKHNIVHNVTIYVECGKEPKLSSFAKVTESEVDLQYNDLKNFSYRSDLHATTQSRAIEQASQNLSIPSVVASGASNDAAFPLSGLVSCETAGGKKFTAIVDICLDYCYQIGQSRLAQQAEHNAKHGQYTETYVSHTVSSNTTTLNKDSMISRHISHADPLDHGVYPVKMQASNEIRDETVFGAECKVLLYEPVLVGQMDIMKFRFVYNGNLLVEHQQVEAIASKKRDNKSIEKLHQLRIMVAAARNNVDELVSLLAHSPVNPEFASKDGLTAIKYAFMNNSFESIISLLIHDVNNQIKLDDSMLIDLIVMMRQAGREECLSDIKPRLANIIFPMDFYTNLAKSLSDKKLKPIIFNDLFDAEPDLKPLFIIAIANKSYDYAKEILLKDFQGKNEIQLDEKMLLDLLVLMQPEDVSILLPIIKQKCAHLEDQIQIFAKIIREKNDQIRFPLMIGDLFDVNKKENIDCINHVIFFRLINFDEKSDPWKNNTMHLLFYAAKLHINGGPLIKNLDKSANALKGNIINFIRMIPTIEKKVEILNIIADPASAMHYVLNQTKPGFTIFNKKEVRTVGQQILAEFASEGLYPSRAMTEPSHR